MASRAAQSQKDREEYLEYLAYLESQGADPAEVKKLRDKAEQGLGEKALDYTVRGLDYLAGLSRGTLAGGLEATTGKELVNLEDVLAGQAPTSSEIMQSMGVPQGAKLSDVAPSLYQPAKGGRFVQQEQPMLEKGGTFDPTVRGTAGFAMDVATDPLTYLTLGGSAVAKKALTPITQASKKAGPAIYKSGLKAMDFEVAKYGKEPASDVLMKYGVTGSAQDIQQAMMEIGDKLLKERTDILKRATKAGAEVDMNAAMAPAQNYINQLKASGDPMMLPVAEALQERVSAFRATAGRPETPRLLELPQSMEKKVEDIYIPQPELSKYIPGVESKVGPLKTIDEVPVTDPLMSSPPTSRVEFQEMTFKPIEEVISLPRQAVRTTKETMVPRSPAVGYVVDPAVPGPDPLRATSYKTSLYNAMPDTAYAKATSVPSGQKGQKLMAKGLKEETEAATMKKLGEAEAERLAQLNDELGRMLTSKDKQAVEARKELMKDTVTSVDAMAAAISPQMALLKKAADISKLTGTRTRAGKAIKEFGESRYAPAVDVAARRKLIDYLQGEE